LRGKDTVQEYERGEASEGGTVLERAGSGMGGANQEKKISREKMGDARKGQTSCRFLVEISRQYFVAKGGGINRPEARQVGGRAVCVLWGFTEGSILSQNKRNQRK